MVLFTLNEVIKEWGERREYRHVMVFEYPISFNLKVNLLLCAEIRAVENFLGKWL